MLCGLGPSLTLSEPSHPHLQEAEAAYVIPSNRGINSSIYLGKVTRAGGRQPALPSSGWLTARLPIHNSPSPLIIAGLGSPTWGLNHVFLGEGLWDCDTPSICKPTDPGDGSSGYTVFTPSCHLTVVPPLFL